MNKIELEIMMINNDYDDDDDTNIGNISVGIGGRISRCHPTSRKLGIPVIMTVLPLQQEYIWLEWRSLYWDTGLWPSWLDSLKLHDGMHSWPRILN